MICIGGRVSRPARAPADMDGGASQKCSMGQAQTVGRLAPETWAMVDVKLGETWSPEQVAGYLKVNGQTTVSHESIY